MHVISGQLQPYAWGRDEGLSPWLATPADGPQAELWFGAHPNGPSPLVGQPGTLADVVEPGDVPLLVKFLAAARPLSIQIHPPAQLAEALFAAGSPLVSDDGEKSELLLALEPFAIFAGWREVSEAAALLRATDDSLEAAAAAVARGDVREAVRVLLSVPTSEVERMTPAVLGAVEHLGGNGEQLHSFGLAARSFPGDPGLLVLLVMDHHLLNQGDAVYMPACGVHAYVQGFGVEVMTASDNVLRLGLTPKPLAVQEALASVSPSGNPHFLGGEVVTDHGRPTVTYYQPNLAPFALNSLHGVSHVAPTGCYRCVVAVHGDVEVRSGDHAVVLAQGQAAAVLAAEDDCHIDASGLAILVESRASD